MRLKAYTRISQSSLKLLTLVIYFKKWFIVYQDRKKNILFPDSQVKGFWKWNTFVFLTCWWHKTNISSGCGKRWLAFFTVFSHFTEQMIHQIIGKTIVSCSSSLFATHKHYILVLSPFSRLLCNGCWITTVTFNITFNGTGGWMDG